MIIINNNYIIIIIGIILCINYDLFKIFNIEIIKENPELINTFLKIKNI